MQMQAGKNDNSLLTIECPECGRQLHFRNYTDIPFFPFCCERCKMLDLAKWFRGDYRIDQPLDPEEDEELPADSQ